MNRPANFHKSWLAPRELSSRVTSYKQAKARQRYDDAMDEAEIDRLDNAASDAEDALIVELMSMGLSKDDARSMTWGLA